MPFLPHADVAKRSHDEGTDIHGNVRQSGHQTSFFDVKFEDIGEVLREISDHREIAAVVTNLETVLMDFIVSFAVNRVKNSDNTRLLKLLKIKINRF